nr:hypothetical protein X990_5650 [Burkholderia pseudomallei MSHR4868]
MGRQPSVRIFLLRACRTIPNLINVNSAGKV